MKRFIQKFLIFTAILSGFLAVSGMQSTSYAALFESAKDQACKGANLDNDAKASSCGTEKSANKVDNILKTIINIISVIVGVAAVITIMINGLRFITAGGDSNTISSARNGIIYAIVGLIIVAFAQVIVQFVLTKL